MTGWTIFRINRYSRLIDNKYYKLTGWEVFFAKRSDDFWKVRNYTNIRISFKLTPGGSDLHRQALEAFTEKVIQKGNKQYQDKDLEWIEGVPNDLQSDGADIYGEISQRELPWVVRILVKFIPVARLLKSHLNEVVLSSDEKEKTYKMKKEKNTPWERNDSWASRH